MPSEVGVLSSDTYMCDNQNSDCRTNDIKVEGHLLGNSYDSVWGSCRRFPPQNMSVCIKVGGLRISEPVNQEGMNLESCSCIFFFEGEWCNVCGWNFFFWNHKYNCEVNLWEGAFWREHSHIEKQRFGMVRGWTVLLTPGLAVKKIYRGYPNPCYIKIWIHLLYKIGILVSH